MMLLLAVLGKSLNEWLSLVKGGMWVRVLVDAAVQIIPTVLDDLIVTWLLMIELLLEQHLSEAERCRTHRSPQRTRLLQRKMAGDLPFLLWSPSWISKYDWNSGEKAQLDSVKGQSDTVKGQQSLPFLVVPLLLPIVVIFSPLVSGCSFQDTTCLVCFPREDIKQKTSPTKTDLSNTRLYWLLSSIYPVA